MTGVISYLSLFNYTKNYISSFIFALIYISSNYFLMNIYQRFALGEILSSMCFPIFLIGAYELFFNDYKKWWLYVLGVVLIIYSHLLSFIFVVLISLVLITVSLIFNRDLWEKKRLKKCLISLVYIGILSLTIILPILEQFMSNAIHSTWRVYSLQPLSFDFIGYYKNSISRQFLFHGIGPIVFLLLFISLSTFFWQNTFEKILTVLTILFILVQTKLFPWFLFNNSALLQVQLLYRFNAYVTLLIAFNVSSMLNKLIKYTKNKKISTFGLLVGIVVFLPFIYNTTYTNWQALPKINEEKIVNKLKIYRNWDYTSKKQFEACEKDQYKTYLKNANDPVKSRKFYCNVKGDINIYRSFVNEIYFNDKKVNLNPKITANKYKLTLHAKNAGELILPMTITKGIIVNLNGKNVNPVLSKYGTLLVNIKKGVNSILIVYKWTIVARLSQLISLLGMIIFVFTIIKKYLNFKINFTFRKWFKGQ